MRARGARAPEALLPNSALRVVRTVKSAIDEAYDAWREADSAVLDAEAQLEAAWQQYIDGRGPLPSVRIREHLNALREIANQRLLVAIALIEVDSPPKEAAPRKR